MSFQDEFAEKVKKTFSPDSDKIIAEKEFQNVVVNYFTQLHNKIGNGIKEVDFYLHFASYRCSLRIRKKELQFALNENHEAAAVTIAEQETAEARLDSWNVKNGHLYSQKSQRGIDDKLVDDLIQEAFGEELEL
nr:MAG TPA: Protein of unknown function (DUF3942) [Caudoviricetes sp.]